MDEKVEKEKNKQKNVDFFVTEPGYLFLEAFAWIFVSRFFKFLKMGMSVGLNIYRDFTVFWDSNIYHNQVSSPRSQYSKKQNKTKQNKKLSEILALVLLGNIKSLSEYSFPHLFCRTEITYRRIAFPICFVGIGLVCGSVGIKLVCRNKISASHCTVLVSGVVLREHN